MWQALAEGCWSLTGVTFVCAVKGLKILTGVIPKNNNGLYWADAILTGLFTSLLSTDAVFTQLITDNRVNFCFMSGIKECFH
jgi:hypothetical protein